MKQVFLAGAMLVAAVGVAAAQPAYPTMPPPPVEAGPPPPPPGAGYVLVPGGYQWNGYRYVWVHRHWVVRQAGYGQWVPAHWAPGGPTGWHWVPGHWRP